MPRRLTENQSAEVLRKAIELQSKESEASMTEQSLRDAARELGIEDRFLEAAFLDAASTNSPTKRGFWGSNPLTLVDVLVPGELDDDNAEGAIQAIRKAFNETGTVSRRGQTVEWIGTAGGLAETTVTLRQADDQVRITLHRNTGAGMFLGYFLSGLFTLMASAVIGAKSGLPKDLAFLAILGTIATVFFLVRWLVASASKREQASISELMRAMEGLLQESRSRLPAASMPVAEETSPRQRIEQS